ncbi:hypothetical protein [Terrarubrum flagellatum]|uniref:hypothetical protein n=1 Tax=Terrirubrum flagellatum TaxID=2895980 RepID=UPI0031450E19
MADVRAKAKKFLDQLPAYDPQGRGDVASNGQRADLFFILTGVTHQSLQNTWKTEDVAKAERRKEGKSTAGLPTTTTCNAFVGKLGGAIGSPISLGQFDIEKKLKNAGLGEAWIPADSGKRPGYGDVFRPIKFHMGVSLDFSGDMWNTAESGQGGPGVDYTKGFDVVKRKQTLWNPASLQGWVDIEILMRIVQKAPKWMIGWWRFEVGPTKEFVYFAERGAARAFPSPPANIKIAPPQTGGKSGSLTYDEDTQGVAIAWPDDVSDTLRHLPGVDYMLGERGGPQLQAYKLK